MPQLSQIANTDQLQIGHCSHPGRSGKNNEDDYGLFLVPTTGGACVVAAVADGIGGSVGGEQASRLAIRTIAGFLEDERYAATSLGQRLDQAIQLANREVFNKAQADPALLGMGTTIVAAALDGDRLHVVHAGDSRAYLVRGGRAHQLTLDHSWAQEAIEAGRITPEAAKTHPNRHVIRRYLGINEDVETDLRTVDPNQPSANGGRPVTTPAPLLTQAGDVILLCSDGLTDEVGDEEIARIAGRYPPDEAARRLVDAANAAGGADNITVVILQRGRGKAAAAGGRSRLAAYGLGLAALLIVAALGWLIASGALFGTPGGSAAASAGNPATANAVTAAVTAAAPAVAQAGAAGPTDTGEAALEQAAAAAGAAAGAAATTPAATPTASATATATPQPSATSTPQPTATAAPFVTSTPSAILPTAPAADDAVAKPPFVRDQPQQPATMETATATPTAMPPTSTPLMRTTPTATATPTAPPTATRRPVMPPTPGAAQPAGNAVTLPSTPVPALGAADTSQAVGAPSAASDPISVQVTNPVGNRFSSTERITFQWTTQGSLPEGQCFELVFWKTDEQWLDGRAPVGASNRTIAEFVPSIHQLSGERRWAVLLVTCAPNSDYKKLKLLSPEYTITFEDGGGANNGGGSEDGDQGGADSGGQPSRPNTLRAASGLLSSAGMR